MTQKQLYRFTPKEILTKWAFKYASLQTYLNKLNARKARTAQSILKFCDHYSTDPDRLLSMKTGYTDFRVEQMLDQFIRESKHPASSNFTTLAAVKGFFRANYRQLQSQAGKLEYVTVKTQRMLTRREKKTVYDNCLSYRDRALFLLTTCSAISLDSLGCLKWRHFEPDWRQQETPLISLPSNIIKGHGKGRFHGVQQTTFITSECKIALINYYDFMTKEKKINWTPDHNVFLINRSPYTPLPSRNISQMFIRLADRSNINFTPHDGRRIVQTALENVGMPNNWIRKIKGRKVRGEEAPYSRPRIEQLRLKYQKAMPELTVLSDMGQSKDKVVKLTKERDNLKTLVEKMLLDREFIEQRISEIVQMQLQEHDQLKKTNY